MGITNRDKDASEKQKSLQCAFDVAVNLVTGASMNVGVVSHPSKFKSGAIAALGVSGTPTYQLHAFRWTSAGSTLIPLGPAATVAANVGLSGGAVTMTSSLIALQTGDLLQLVSGGANSAALKLNCAIVLEALQDIKEELGSQS